jgi:hypothetical protein
LKYQRFGVFLYCFLMAENGKNTLKKA